jgi:phosphoenolpyruvate carboxylase
VELPGWYGFGAALEAFRGANPRNAGTRLVRLYEDWPFFRSIADHARLALARADLALARGYAALASEPRDTERWSAIEAEFERTRGELDRLPAPSHGEAGDRAEIEARRRSGALRAPYVDTLSVVQLELLRTLREREAADPANPTLPVIRSLIGLTISGLSAALQGTG